MNIYSTIVNGYQVFSLDFIAVAAITSAVAVIISKNPIVSVLFLIGLFLSVSSYLMLLGLNFIGLSYLLVYVGAISILFLFILMLINVRISEIVSLTSNSIPLAIMIGLLFLSTIYPALPVKMHNSLIIDKIFTGFNLFRDTGFSNYVLQGKDIYNTTGSKNNNLDFISGFVNAPNWDSMLADSAYINSLGNILYTTYPLWIILTSLVLLLAMVGCILISVK